MEPPKKVEIEQLVQLRKQIGDLDMPEEELMDKNLIRWLRARNHNLKDAETMIRKNREWLVQMDMANILENGVPLGWDEELPWTLTGFDNNGSPICLTETSKWDVRKLMEAGRKQEYIRYAVHTLEEKYKIVLLQSEGRDYIPQLVTIYDLSGITWRQMSCTDSIDASLTLVRIAEANYPEMLGCLILVNVPRIFQILWRLMSPFMTERTLAKIVFLGSDKQEWTTEISKRIPVDQFPKAYGGIVPDSVNKLFDVRRDIKNRWGTNTDKKDENNDEPVVRIVK